MSHTNTFLRAVTNATRISNRIADMVYSSIAWTGAARLANNVGTSFENADENVYLASYASKISDVAMRPTVDDVLELVTTVPELVEIDELQRKTLNSVGMSDEEINQTAADNFRRELGRHKAIKTNINKHEAELVATLSAAFNTEPETLTVALSPNVLVSLMTKIHDKLVARRGALMATVLRGAATQSELDELKAVNAELESEIYKKAA